MWTWNSDPFGTDAANPNPAGAGTFAYNLRFPGQLFDGQAGLHQNGFRDFDPAIGRYGKSDPVGLRGGINTYLYAEAQPIMTADPSGLLALTVGASWSMVDSLPNTHGGGLTRGFIAPARCVCKGCGNSWTLSECSAFLDIEVQLLARVSDPREAAFYRNSEAQHVADLETGANGIRSAGEAFDSRRTFQHPPS